QLLAELEEAVGRDLTTYEHLHRIRILGKRLRYAMEIFAACFAPSFRQELYPAVEQMQEILGHATDSHVASVRLEAVRERLCTRLAEGWKRLRPGVDGLLRFHRTRLPRQRKRFQAWWQHWRQSGLADAFDTLLNGKGRS